ncbi:MAG: hypothetical protein IJ504_05900 [Bacteroidales bacterium]|nr:hypothetical protein [Bacteroidales bacterium]
MKDTILTVRRKKIEIVSFLACFVLANLIHIYAIVKYDASFSEMVTSFFYVLCFSVILYLAWCLIRLLIYAVVSLCRK